VLILFLIYSIAQAGGPFGSAMFLNLNATKRSVVDASGQAHIYSLLIINASGAVAWAHFYDQPCAGVTQGTTTPTFVIPMATNTKDFMPFPITVDFFTEICVTSTTTFMGTTGSANGVGMTIFAP
jgi:hypothetical protein